MAIESHGTHVMLDYTGFHLDKENLGEWMLKLIEKAVDMSAARRVHSHIEVFDGQRSPSGFAAVVLLDESHVSAHCYTEKGWLALDCFTCGETDPNIIADSIHKALIKKTQKLKLINRTQQPRFMYERD